MITLPPYHVPTKYEGYFYNVENKRLYSIKLGNKLTALKQYYPNRFNRIPFPGYYISVEGRRKFVPVTYLRSLSIFDTLDKTGWSKA